jgi:hypothetical protein
MYYVDSANIVLHQDNHVNFDVTVPLGSNFQGVPCKVYCSRYRNPNSVNKNGKFCISVHVVC